MVSDGPDGAPPSSPPRDPLEERLRHYFPSTAKPEPLSPYAPPPAAPIPPEWKAPREWDADRPRHGISEGLLAFAIAAVLLILVMGGFLLWIIVTPGCACPHSVTSAVNLVPATAGNCTADGVLESTYSVDIGGTTATLTTANFGLALTEAGASGSTPPGAATPSPSGTCYATPASNGWFAVLIPSGGGGSDWATFTSSGWQACVGSPTAPCTAISALAAPVTISGGMTLLLTAGPNVPLSASVLSVFGTNGESVTGSTTL